MSVATDILQQMLSADASAGEGVATPAPPAFGDTANSIVTQMLESPIDPTDINHFLTRSDVLSRPLVNPFTKQTFVPDNVELLKQQLKDNLKELTQTSAKEALKAEFFLLPGLVGAGLDFVKESPLMDPWSKAIAHTLDMPISAIEAGSDIENVPAAAFESYGRTYHKMIDLEAELAITTEKLAEAMANPVHAKTAGPTALVAATVANTAGNLVIGFANPMGLVAHGTAAGIRLTTRGLLAAGTAFVGRKGMQKLMTSAATSKGGRGAFGKLINTLTGIGRLPATHGSEEAMEQAGRIARAVESAKKPDANGAVPLLTDIETSHPLKTRHELAEEVVADFGKAKKQQAEMFLRQEQRKAAGIPQPAGIQTIPEGDPFALGVIPPVRGLDVQGVRALEDASRLDFQVKKELGIAQASVQPIQSTNLYRAAMKEVDRMRIIDVDPKVTQAVSSLENPGWNYPKSGPVAYREVVGPHGEVERIPVAKFYKGKNGQVKVRKVGKKDDNNSFVLAAESQAYYDNIERDSRAARKLTTDLRGGGKQAQAYGKELDTAIEEMDRAVKQGRERPNAPARVTRTSLDGLGDIPNAAHHGEMIAGRFVHNRQMALMDSAYHAQSVIDAVPDVATRQDMIALLEETGNPWLGPDDTIDMVRARIDAQPNADVVYEMAESVRQRLDLFFDEVAELNMIIGDNEIGYVDNYLQHIWAEPAAQVKDKFSRTKRFQLSATGRFEKKRTVATMMDGMHEAGLTPTTDDIARVLLVAEDQYARVMATKKLAKDLMEFGVSDDGQLLMFRIKKGDAVPDGFVEFRSAFTDRILPDVLEGESKLVMDKSLHQQFKNILVQPHEPGNFEKLSAVAKRSNFFFTLFHMYSLSESGMALLPTFTGKNAGEALMNGLTKAPITVGTIGKKAVFGSRSKWNQGEALAHLVSAPTYREATELASFYGVRLGAPPVDVAKDQAAKVFDATIRGIERKAGKKSAEAVKKLTAPARNLQKWIDTTLWERFHSPMKVVSFDMVYQNLKGIRDGTISGVLPGKMGLSRKMLQGMDDDRIGREVAKFVNDEFGGQNWEQHVTGFMGHIADPDMVRRLNGIFLSVDWNVSSLRAGTAVVQAIPGPAHNPVRGILGARHWRNAVMGWYMYANMTNKMLSGKYMWENEKGKDVFHINTGQVDEDGRPIYLHIGKQFRELGTLAAVTGGRGAVPVQDFLARKTMPWIKAAVATADPFKEINKLERDFMREGKELGWDERAWAGVKAMAGGFTPISVSGQLAPAVQGRPASRVASALGFPASKGKRAQDFVPSLAEAIRAGDSKTLDEILLSMQTHPTDAVAEAMNKARRLAFEFPTGGELEPEEDKPSARRWLK